MVRRVVSNLLFKQMQIFVWEDVDTNVGTHLALYFFMSVVLSFMDRL